MRKFLTIAAVTGSMALVGCVSENQERQVTGAVIGGGLGLITSKVLGADNDWVVVSTLAGAAAGALVAKNQQTGLCAYARGDGTYYRAPCP